MKRLALVNGFWLLLVAVSFSAEPMAAQRPANWGEPISVSGVENFHKVTDSLYRGAQPTAVGVQHLKERGVKTIISLRAMHDDADELGKTGLGHEHISMKTWHPEREDVVRFLKVVTDPTRGPVFVHCRYGSDRTGTMCAVYRVAVQGWTKEEAVREMTQGGYGYHAIWKNLPDWIQRLDIDAIRKEAGIQTPPGK